MGSFSERVSPELGSTVATELMWTYFTGGASEFQRGDMLFSSQCRARNEESKR